MLQYLQQSHTWPNVYCLLRQGARPFCSISVPIQGADAMQMLCTGCASKLRPTPKKAARQLAIRSIKVLTCSLVHDVPTCCNWTAPASAPWFGCQGLQPSSVAFHFLWPSASWQRPTQPTSERKCGETNSMSEHCCCACPYPDSSSCCSSNSRTGWKHGIASVQHDIACSLALRFPKSSC